MTITHGYCTLAELKRRIGLDTYDTDRDTDLELLIQAASRKIDKHCGRYFYAGTAGTISYVTAQSAYRVYMNDFSAITAVETDDDGDGTYENSWASTDYIKMPINLPYGWPYTWLQVSAYGDYSFPRGLTNGVKITGTDGWVAVPDEVREAAFLLCNRLWQRRNAPFGVAGANEFGVPVVIVKLDPDVIELLNPFTKAIP